jgi:chromosome segregation ATPase
MKLRGQVITSDGFDKTVAEKMPKVKKEEESSPVDQAIEPRPTEEDRQERDFSEPETGQEAIPQPPRQEPEEEQNPDVLKLVEDLHSQLLFEGRARRALEIDLVSHQKSVRQLTQDNRELRRQIEVLEKEVQRLKALQSESAYLKEENADALERIQELQQELTAVNEAFDKTLRERDEALNQVSQLQEHIEQSDIFRIKGKLKEREASQLSEENRDLRHRLEEFQTQNMELERKYEEIRRSFNEVKESLTLLRDSCKSSFYQGMEESE